MDILTRFFEQTAWEQLIFTTLRVTLIVVLVAAALFAARVLLGRLEQRLVRLSEKQGELPGESRKRAETLVRLVRQAALIVIWIMGALVLLRELGIEITPILASVGIASLAVGFGAQNLVRDVIAGFFMILENQVRVGDVATVNGTGGLVEQINFRTIVLRDLAGTVHVFPNGSVTTLANLTQEWSAAVLDIGVAYKEDIDRVIEIMRRVGAELRADATVGPAIIADMEIFGVDNFADSAIVIKCRLKTQPIRQWEIGREYRRRLKKAFDEAGVEIPFPHRTLYFGEQQEGALAALAGSAAKHRAQAPPSG